MVLLLLLSPWINDILSLVAKRGFIFLLTNRILHPQFSITLIIHGQRPFRLLSQITIHHFFNLVRSRDQLNTLWVKPQMLKETLRSMVITLPPRSWKKSYSTDE